MEPIHKRFRRLRAERDFSVKQFAEKIGVPESTYREWEYGRTLPGPPFLKMAEALNVPLSFLMTGESSREEWIFEALVQIEFQVIELKAKLAARI